LRAAYQAADVVVVPSIYPDPFPTINIEAMACGKPVITTCFGGGREAVVDGVTGYVINPFDTVNLADVIVNLLQHPERVAEIGVAARQRAKEYFDITRHAAKLLAAYHRLIDRKNID
jgi:glycosyltransferase involved in cell wall biosynthesis